MVEKCVGIHIDELVTDSFKCERFCSWQSTYLDRSDRNRYNCHRLDVIEKRQLLLTTKYL
ncbi:hypothetical protein Pse7367_0520 [Thalassoporum mexicanum PCC 7367]|uniref:hypothetical protein n=1 Tax=Thalassoporum mexicanum TaxID=3457544 RepID=UPI00029F8647|nr:hypothetical protein [Pseudanabaena sp. PCC 7367]AFY68828.1 hypothetical protein Pse7367_0520 [Pseudanabaena sp. PCC 7367]